MPRHTIIRHTLATHSRSQMIEITLTIDAFARQKNLADGFVIVYVPHTTAAITIQENADPAVKHDLLAKLESQIPQRETYYEHDEGNSDAHLKASLLGQSVTVLIENGKLQLGRWQGVYFCEFDGSRERQVWMKFVDLGIQTSE